MNELHSMLVAIDLEETSANYVLECASRLAPGTPLEVVHVLERHVYGDYGDPGAALVADLHARTVREIEQYLSRICGSHGIERFKLLEGHAATMIQQRAAAEGHDLIVLGTHGRHGIRRLLGSTANAVLHGTGCNVLAIRVPGPEVSVPAAADKYRHVLAAVDLSDESSQVLDIARRVSSSDSASLDVAHVIKPFRHAYAGVNPASLSDLAIQFEHEASKQARSIMSDLLARYGLGEPNGHVLHGAPAIELQGLASELASDLLVIGTHGKQGLQLLLGSVANAVIHGIKCDVLAVRIR